MLLVPSSDISRTLPPSDRAVAELKAIVGGRLSKADFLRVVRATGAVDQAGKAWSHAKLNECLERLVRKRVLTSDGVVAAEWREPLTLSFLGRTDCRALLAAVRQATPIWLEEDRPRYWGRPASWEADLARAVRLTAMANDEPEVERLIGLAEQDDGRGAYTAASGALLLQGCPADVGFIDALSPGLRDRVASAHVELLIDHG